MDLGSAMGPPFIGAILATALWGMTCMQTLVYFMTYHRDAWPLKGFIITLWVLDTVHEVLCFNALWQTFIPQFGSISVVTTFHVDFMYQWVVSGIVALVARAFFTWRIWLFSNKNWIFPFLIIPPSIVDTVEGIIFAVKGAGKPLDQLGGLYNHAFIAATTLTVTDAFVVLTMCTLLWRRRTGFAPTDRLIVRLMSASVTTGAWTAIFGLLTSILLAVRPQGYISFLVQFPICPLYCNAVLGNLNSRRYLAETSALIDDFSSRGLFERHTRPIRFATLFSSNSATRNAPGEGGMEGGDGVQVELDLRNKNA